jgi:hypothetical protein
VTRVVSVRKRYRTLISQKECLNSPAGPSGDLEVGCEGSAGEGSGEEVTTDEAVHVSFFCIDTSSATRSSGSD